MIVGLDAQRYKRPIAIDNGQAAREQLAAIGVEDLELNGLLRQPGVAIELHQLDRPDANVVRRGVFPFGLDAEEVVLAGDRARIELEDRNSIALIQQQLTQRFAIEQDSPRLF